ncbi:hypothetical protein [Pseudomonas nitroreducens]|uniref:hypothetical protein n=1 Tax=Pseudomonas nitroreducens TaxID=46680 RepID=UPI00209F062C|nr:hypothetical protein [Pseudomonas nitroreducens]MCP1621436.1 hypothetical protein [Pseudomonas nitroreducens]
MDIWEVLQDELERYRSSALAVRHCTNAYEARCVVLIKEISSKSFDEAQGFFDELYEIQSKLAIAKYKYEFKLADRLDEFVYCFERDDSLSREYWYKNFRAGLEWPHEE